jgi:hypothetical protein
MSEPQSFEDHFNEQNKGFGNEPNDIGRRGNDIARDSDELHQRYEGQPGTHGLDEGDQPYYQVDHPSGWHVRTYGGPYLEVGHQATGSESHEAINVGYGGPDGSEQTKIHPALTQGTPDENHNALARELSAFVSEHGDEYASNIPKIKRWQAMNGMKNEALKKQAHDSGDGETIYHCPFCGSGQVIARSDKTIECQFCHVCFTVQVQPEFSAFPQTIDGVPVAVPGMPGQIDSGAPPDLDENGQPMDPEDPDGDVPPPQAGADGEVPNDDPPGPGGEDSTGGNPFTSGLKTISGKKVSLLDYLAHLAITSTGNRQETIAQVRRWRS